MIVSQILTGLIDAAVAQDQQNWRLNKAQNDARQRFLKVRDEEVRKLAPENPGLKNLYDKLAEVQTKINPYNKEQK